MSPLQQFFAARPHLSSDSLAVLAGVWAFLLVATLVGLTLGRLKPGSAMKTVNQRIHAWWPMTGLVSLGLVAGEGFFLLLMALVSFLALKEFFSLVPTRRADHRALFWSYGSILVQYAAIHFGWIWLFVLYIPLYHLLVGPIRLALRRNTDGFLRSSSAIHWGLMLTVFSLSHVAQLMSMGDAGLVLFLLLLTELNDVSQFLWGKLFGERKVLPEVSPNKTWVGVLGGMLNTSLLGAALAPMLTPLSHSWGALVGMLLALAGFMGDIVLSAVKRDMGVKDASTLIPGHGGILDRVDSLSYTAPVFFYIIWLGWGL